MLYIKNFPEIRHMFLRKARASVRDLLPPFLPIPYYHHGSFRFMWLPKLHWAAFIQNRYEPTTMELFSRLIKDYKVDLFIDIGANAGMYSTLACRCEVAHVVSFEPSKKYFYWLKKNTVTHHAVTTINKGVGEKAEAKQLILTDEPGSNFIGSKDTEKNLVEWIDLIDLDTFISSTDIKIIKHCLIKIDVEGYELFVLKGMQQVLKNTRPLIVIELDDEHLRRQETSKQEVIKLLEDNGYFVESVAESMNSVAVPKEFCQHDGFRQTLVEHEVL